MGGSVSWRGLADFAATAVSQDEKFARLAVALTTVVDPPLREAADGELRHDGLLQTEAIELLVQLLSRARVINGTLSLPGAATGSDTRAMTDKRKLLDQLKIYRLPSEGSGGVAWTATLLIAAVAAVLGAGGTYLLADSRDSVNADAGHRDDAVAQPQSIPAPAAAAPEPERKSAGENDNGQRILEAAGYVAARRIATVSAEITGRIFEVNVEEGTVVEQGQVLAKLDDAVAVVNLELARANVMALSAQLESIGANLAEARRVRARSEELWRRSLISEAEVTRDKATVDALSANLRSAEANRAVATLEVKRQRELLDDHIIRAPFAGVVTDKNAQTGEIVSPNSAGEGFTRSGICTIVDMDSLEIEVDVNEAFIGRVFVGQTVEANLDAYPDWDIRASVIAVIPTADRAKATVRVRIGFNERDARILPDMGVKVAFFG